MRYDVPLLDESFTRAEVPPPEEEGAETQRAPELPVTALDRNALAVMWEERQIARSLVDSATTGSLGMSAVGQSAK